MVMVLCACYTLTEVLRVSSSTWLSVWTSKSTSKSYKPGFFILVYGLLSFGQVSRRVTGSRFSLLHVSYIILFSSSIKYLNLNLLDSGNSDTDELFLVNHVKPSCSQKIARCSA